MGVGGSHPPHDGGPHDGGPPHTHGHTTDVFVPNKKNSSDNVASEQRDATVWSAIRNDVLGLRDKFLPLAGKMDAMLETRLMHAAIFAIFGGLCVCSLMFCCCRSSSTTSAGGDTSAGARHAPTSCAAPRNKGSAPTYGSSDSSFSTREVVVRAGVEPLSARSTDDENTSSQPPSGRGQEGPSGGGGASRRGSGSSRSNQAAYSQRNPKQNSRNQQAKREDPLPSPRNTTHPVAPQSTPRTNNSDPPSSPGRRSNPGSGRRCSDKEQGVVSGRRGGSLVKSSSDHRLVVHPVVNKRSSGEHLQQVNTESSGSSGAVSGEVGGGPTKYRGFNGTSYSYASYTEESGLEDAASLFSDREEGVAGRRVSLSKGSSSGGTSPRGSGAAGVGGRTSGGRM